MEDEVIQSIALLILGLAIAAPFVFIAIKSGRFIKDLKKERREEFIRSLTDLTK